MKEILVALFPDERAAYAGWDALNRLHGRGDIALNAAAVLVKEHDGALKIRAGREHGATGILVGLIGGGLIGGFGGPIAAIAGACVGMIAGLVHDVFSSDFASDLVDEVGAILEPGGFSVIADVNAKATPIDQRMAVHGGRVLRRIGGRWVDEERMRQPRQTALVLRGMTSR